MANFFRLAFFFFFSFLSVNSFAGAGAWYYSGPPYFSSSAAACKSVIASSPGYTVDHVVEFTTGTTLSATCWFKETSSGTVFQSVIVTFDPTATPPAPACPAAGASAGDNVTFRNTGGATSICLNSCVAECTGTVCVGGAGTAAQPGGFSYGSWTYSGASCTTVPGTVIPSDCPPGQVSGTFNGAIICLPSAPATNTKTSTSGTSTVTNADASTTATTTTNNTTCSGAGSCNTVTTTTTVTTPAGGGTPTTTTQTKSDTLPQQTFCADHPNDAACKPLDSSFGASCTALPACSGDAVQCAQAQAAWETNCVLHPDPGAISDLGSQAAAGGDPLASNFPNSPANLSTVDVGSVISGSAGTRWLGSSDLTNPSFVVLGHSFTLDLGLLSRFLRAIGYVFVAVAGVIAARILGS